MESEQVVFFNVQLSLMLLRYYINNPVVDNNS